MRTRECTQKELAMRPRVMINIAPSLDGKIAPARKNAPFVMSRHTGRRGTLVAGDEEGRWLRELRLYAAAHLAQ
jgi:riboflavin biosynthesis pyrimidine reductase